MAVDGTSINVAAGVFIATAIVTVGLRLWAGRLRAAPVTASDYLIVAGAVWVIGFLCVCIYDTTLGLGQHLQDVVAEKNDPKMEWLVAFKKSLIAIEITYVVGLGCVKLSVLLLIRRIFPTPAMRMASAIMCGILVAYIISLTLVAIFACTPVEASWLLVTPPGAKCINPLAYYIGASVANIVTDVIILALPIREITKLQLAMRTKVSISGIFLLGGFVVIASCLRLGFIVGLDQSDVTSSDATVTIWSEIEVGVAVVSACLPTLRPVARKVFPDWLSQKGSSNSGPQRATPTIGGTGQKSNKWLKGGHTGRKGSKNAIIGGATSTSGYEEMDDGVELVKQKSGASRASSHRIPVTRSIEVEHV